MQPEKCATCEFWERHGESEQSPGNCHRQPPMIQFVAVEQTQIQKLNKQPGQYGMQPYFPVTMPNGFCGEHPDSVRRRARDLHYNPSEHGDGNAGFNHAPSLREVMKYAVGVESMKKRIVELNAIRVEDWTAENHDEHVNLFAAIRLVDPDYTP